MWQQWVLLLYNVFFSCLFSASMFFFLDVPFSTIININYFLILLIHSTLDQPYLRQNYLVLISLFYLTSQGYKYYSLLRHQDEHISKVNLNVYFRKYNVLYPPYDLQAINTLPHQYLPVLFLKT